MNPVTAIEQLLARQSHAIDEGDARGWAETFTAEGEFTSPTYARPVAGRAALTEFAQQVHAANPRQRHVLANVHVVEHTEVAARSRSTLLIIHANDDEIRIARMSTVEDTFDRVDGHWLMSTRVVRPA